MAATIRELLTDKQESDLEGAGRLALSDGQAREEILAGLVSKDDAYRYNCFQVVYQISLEQPEVLYPEWDRFVALLGSGNSYHRSIGGRLLASLAGADTEGRFDGILDRCFALLDDEKIITARQFAQHVGRIARAKPHLRDEIIERLLAVDATHHQAGRKDLLKGDVVTVLEELLDDVPDQRRILAFVEEQTSSSSPKTRKAAQAFLKRHGIQSGGET